ncbi:uncharacterized protein LOC122089774 [Macadamia integrifolia]|uniref:uncharacterized protein LOC122089774 n=1 Tax=Macadamia integrifolia TaxID=60698 RepID=UPI001C4FC867|nr:uncharacterized protein LOC122089774 [Macadamia integrifolia]
MEADCPRCQQEEETTMHLILQCPFAKAVWFASSVSLHSDIMIHESFVDWLEQWFFKSKQMNDFDKIDSIVAFISWELWKSRNSFIFKNNKEFTQQVVDARKHRSSINAVIRDDAGNFIAGSIYSDNSTNMLQLEARAIKNGMLLAIKTGIDRLVIESDSVETYLSFNQYSSSFYGQLWAKNHC